MGIWRVAQAKARFSAVLDKAETEGPQLVTRRKQQFYVLTKEQLGKHGNPLSNGDAPFVSGWDALAPSSGATFDIDFPRLRSKPRAAKF